MESTKQIILLIHIITGSIALVSFWLPVLSRKGGVTHRVSGKIYVLAMWVTMGTAILLGVANFFLGYFAVAAFLTYLALLTSYPLWYGAVSLRMKKGLTTMYLTINRAFVWVLFLAGIALIGYGFHPSSGGWSILMWIFAGLGILQCRDLVRSNEAIRRTYVPIIQHIRGMIISGIAAHTAFAAFGGRQVLGSVIDTQWMIIPWVLPTIIGVVMIKVAKRRWQHKKVDLGAMAVATLLVVVCIQSGYGQHYTEKKTRHRFAEMTVGVDIQRHLGTELSSLRNGSVSNFRLNGQLIPRILIGGTHFWGHADFSISFPLRGPSQTIGDDRVTLLSGVETSFKYYPWRITTGKIRPFIGFSLTDYYYTQVHLDRTSGNGPEASSTRLPVVFGLTYRQGSHLLEAGFTYNYGPAIHYPLSASVMSSQQLPRLWSAIAYKYTFDTTISAEESWESGGIQDYTDQLAKAGKLDNFFIGIGISSAWWMRQSPYSQSERPALLRNAVNTMLDATVGYYWHDRDVDVNLVFRSYGGSQSAYNVTHEYDRLSLGLECKKFLGDYHGFVPFIGPIVSHEQLRFRETTSSSNFSVNDNKITAGVTFGWDIRPNRVQWFILRTNLRYFPRLSLNTPEGQVVSFDNIEFNFIQMVVYPGRL